MARARLLCSFLLLAIACSAAAASFDDSNPIRLVSDGGLDSSILQIVGQTRHAFSFARFASRLDVEAHEMIAYLVVFLVCRFACSLLKL